MSAKLTLSLVFAVVTVVLGANILDFLDFDNETKFIQVPELRNDQPNRNCLCKGPACVCCANFNITFVDLGGPGCVHMKYVSPEEGFSVKVSYGKTLIHSSKMQGANPAPICLEVFGKFAQVCAKFNDLAPTADGLRGCIELEPRLLGDGQIQFPLGCFKSTDGGMEMEDPPAEPETTTEDDESETDTEDPSGFDAESFIASVYQTAELGVSFLNRLLDIPNKLNLTQTVATSTAKPVETASQAARTSKKLKHPNQL